VSITTTNTTNMIDFQLIIASVILYCLFTQMYLCFEHKHTHTHTHTW